MSRLFSFHYSRIVKRIYKRFLPIILISIKDEELFISTISESFLENLKSLDSFL